MVKPMSYVADEDLTAGPKMKNKKGGSGFVTDSKASYRKPADMNQKTKPSSS